MVIVSIVQSTRTQKVSYREEHERWHEVVSRHPYFAKGRLLDTLERGVAFPVLHLHDEESKPLPSNALGDDLALMQGVYAVIEQVPIDGVAPSPSPCSSTSYSYIFMGFKQPVNSRLLPAWKDWTGARYIYLNWDISSMTFYQLTSKPDPNRLPFFDYILLVACGTMSQQQDTPHKLLDFVHRLRVKHMGTYVAAYECSTTP